MLRVKHPARPLAGMLAVKPLALHDAISYLQEQFPYRYIYIENVFNPRLEASLNSQSESQTNENNSYTNYLQ